MPAHAQSCPEELYGGWTTLLPVDGLLRTELRVVPGDGNEAVLETDAFRFVGKMNDDTDALPGFVYYAQGAYRVTLEKENDGWVGEWGPLPVPGDSVPFDLFVDDDGEGGTGGYFFFRDQRLPGLYGLGGRCDGNEVEFGELNLGLTFKGEFDDAFTVMTTEVSGLGGTVSVTWTRMSEEQQAVPAGTSGFPPRDASATRFADRAPEQTGDGWATTKPSTQGIDPGPIDAMIRAVAAGDLPNAHSVLVARGGKLVIEEYFYGFDRDVIHDMRSASKSIASTLVGLAIERDMLEDANVRVLDYLDYEDYDNWDERKQQIELRHLMTMSSGLDANDSDRNSVASENNYQWQRGQPDWIKFALDSSMIADPGTRVIYGSANPMIIAGVLESATGQPVEWFADEALFTPLGIDDYKIYMRPDYAGAYLGGGMYLKPRDMLKIGQLYLDNGIWNGKRLLSREWVEESFGQYGRLEPLDRNGNQYGYLWWHENYDVDGRTIASIEARGNGGQYIAVLPEFNAVAVLTAGNYQGGLEMTRQSQRMLRDYVLPALARE